MSALVVRLAITDDVGSILTIYNQGIEDRIATPETVAKDIVYMEQWFQDHQGRYTVLVAEQSETVVGWASLNPYSHGSDNSVAALSIYIEREFRGQGVGSTLLEALEYKAKENQFYKIVLFTFPFNQLGQHLYRKFGYREVGVFEEQDLIDNTPINVMIMEKLIHP